ncbi:class F sortase [Arthrobacter castelli]|uniref:class F sortase n=1 Tax=Arthrobacter castelli TaxID=271431 RepID=UPI00138AB9A0|nr:class F sortase [Arthrobacter castelli]
MAALNDEQGSGPQPVEAASPAQKSQSGAGEEPRKGQDVRQLRRPTTKDAAATMSHSQPVQLAIPAIEAGSRLLTLGLQSDGTMEVPRPGQADMAGWYRHSPAPGQLGPAVIAGHVDSLDDGTGVFYRLSSLQQGDEVRVTRADGLIAIFTVETVASYSKESFPTEKVYGDIDHAGLRLITCGDLNEAAGEYQANTVVFASLDRIDHPPSG